ncbi:hypothetical protein [Streptomyces endophyticus]|uniref:Uncharacterized protein n=1 Tax=Streptomyces endophyticus TaxID=714166 RepID=A0ABU6FJ48_9ACTN|nr:hypothetical protein [Streptomyces endophyticus]MEB8344078.1 hypothetical protein [Streptomyces endophyticus]
MTAEPAEPAKVIVALPVTSPTYFNPRYRSSIARKAKNALRVAEQIGGSATVTVILHGRAVDQVGHGSTVAHSEVDQANFDEWAADWAVLPNASSGVLDDPSPRNEVGRRFGISDSFYGHAQAVDVMNSVMQIRPLSKGLTCVILCLDSRFGVEEMIRSLARIDRTNIFWQICGDPSDIGYDDFWGKDGLKRGGVVPNLRAQLSSSWTPWLVARRFKAWRKNRG